MTTADQQLEDDFNLLGFFDFDAPDEVVQAHELLDSEQIAYIEEPAPITNILCNSWSWSHDSYTVY